VPCGKSGFGKGAGRVDHLIDHRTVDFEARARLGIELILDAIGGQSLKKGYLLSATRADRQARDV
jgi:hypothetical protein